MQVIRVDPSSQRHIREFVNLPYRLYAGTPQWVPPLLFEAAKVFDRKHPYYDENEAQFFLAVNDAGKTIGRLAVLDNQRYNRYQNEKTAFFTLFECIKQIDAAQALFEAAIGWAKQRGLNRLTGPKGFTVFDGQGMLVKGFEHRPAFGLPYNFDYYPNLMEGIGFKGVGELVSGYLGANTRFPDRLHEAAERIKARRGLRVTHFESRKELRSLIPILRELYNGALGGTTGTVPISEAEAKALGDQMIWFANPHLIKIVFKNEQPVGFLFAYPDVSAAIQRTGGKLFPFGWIQLLTELRRTKWININGAGMIEGYRGLGGMAILFSEMYKSVVEEGYQHADLVQIGVENDRMQRELSELGIEFYKSHRQYSLELGSI